MLRLGVLVLHTALIVFQYFSRAISPSVQQLHSIFFIRVTYYSGILFYTSERYYNFWSIFLVRHRFVKSFTFLVTEISIWYVLLAIFWCGFLNQPCELHKNTFIHLGNITAIFVHVFMDILFLFFHLTWLKMYLFDIFCTFWCILHFFFLFINSF